MRDYWNHNVPFFWERDFSSEKLLLGGGSW